MGLAAVLLAVFALAGGDDDDDTTSGGETSPQDITVVQARGEIPAHQKLTEEDLEEVVVQDSTVPDPDDVAQSINEVIGFAYSEPLVEGQRILRSRLEVSGIAEELEPGRRAISVPVDTNNLVAGLVRQDDSIDIVYEINAELLRVTPTTPLEIADALELRTEVIIPPFGEQPDPLPYPYPGEPGSRFVVTDSEGGNPVAKVVLQNIRVLRVINSSSLDPTGEGQGGEDEDFLVLDVTPEQAEMLHMMQQVGTFQVMLRGVDDDTELATRGINLELLVTQYNLPVPKTVRLPEAGAQ
jgi:pilus assembly protein CpaB